MNRNFFSYNTEYNVEDLIYAIDAWLTFDHVAWGVLAFVFILGVAVRLFLFRFQFNQNSFLMDAGVIISLIFVFIGLQVADEQMKKGKVELSNEEMTSIVQVMTEREFSLFKLVEDSQGLKNTEILTIDKKDLERIVKEYEDEFYIDEDGNIRYESPDSEDEVDENVKDVTNEVVEDPVESQADGDEEEEVSKELNEEEQENKKEEGGDPAKETSNTEEAKTSKVDEEEE